MADPPAVAVDVVAGPSSDAVTRKRKGSDLTQPADKKAKVIAKTREPDNPAAPHSNPGGILSQICNRFSSPFPIADTHFVVINTADMAGWYESIWRSLVDAIYPDHRFHAAGVITQANFVLVCRYLTKSRIDHVYATTSGRRPNNRIAIPREFEVPKCFADVINGIGSILILSGSYVVIPQPEEAPQDQAQRLETLVGFQLLASFERLVKAASARGLIRTAFISSVPEGTAWWLLTARSPADPATIANGLDSVDVRAVFKEWTPADGILCAIVQRQNDGLFPDEVALLMWAFDTVRGISGLRNTFALDA